MIFIAVKFKVRPEFSDQFIERSRSFTEATRAEPGNLWFDWSRSVDDPNLYVLVEAFRDGEAGAKHVQSEHFQRVIKEMPEFLQETPDIINVEVPGTEWSKMGEMTVERR